ncbi:MAG: hypothetical protein Q8R20_03115 [Nanoarchaeota archaeon]|nr:hypothetical protein [Nanoarchaeota archaeon]
MRVFDAWASPMMAFAGAVIYLAGGFFGLPADVVGIGFVFFVLGGFWTFVENNLVRKHFVALFGFAPSQCRAERGRQLSRVEAFLENLNRQIAHERQVLLDIDRDMPELTKSEKEVAVFVAAESKKNLACLERMLKAARFLSWMEGYVLNKK